MLSGGFGERVCSVLATNGLNTKVKTFGLPDEPIVHGSVAELDKHYGLDADSIAEYIIRKIKNGKDKT